MAGNNTGRYKEVSLEKNFLLIYNYHQKALLPDIQAILKVF